MPTMTIRPADDSDVAAVVACVDSAYGPFVEPIGRTPAPMLDDYCDLIGRNVVDVAVEDDLVVGVIVHWSVGFDGGDGHWFIDNIAVEPGRQGSGVGGMLLAHAEFRARAMGHDRIRLFTNEAMIQNQEWYPRHGFVETHRRLDRGYARIFYTRTLAPPS